MSPQDGLHEDLKKAWQALKPHCFPCCLSSGFQVAALDTCGKERAKLLRVTLAKIEALEGSSSYEIKNDRSW